MKKQVIEVAAVVCLLAASTQAQLFLRDPFVTVAGTPDTARGEYQTGLDLGDALHSRSVGGEIVGFATTNLWTESTNGVFKPQNSGLNYSAPAMELATLGGALVIDRSGQDDVTAELSRRIQGVVATPALYFSALLKATADSDGSAVVQFNDVNGLPPTHSPGMWGLGFGFQSGKLVLITRSGSDSRVTHTLRESYAAGTSYFIVVRVVVDTGIGLQYNDTVSVWINPTNLLSTQSADLPEFQVNINTITSNEALLIDELKIVTSAFGGGIVSFDEISYGRQLGDVVRTRFASELILYDDFRTDSGQYSATTELKGQNPWRPGFAGPWRDSTSAYWKPYTENLAYTTASAVLMTSGGSAQVIMPSLFDRKIYRSTSNIVENVIYISSLMSFDADGGADDFAYAELFDSSDTTYYAGIQWGLFNGEIAIRCRSEAGVNNSRFVVGSGTYVEGANNLFVLKIEKNINEWRDRVTVYLNPTDLRSEAVNGKDLELITSNILGTTVLDTLMLRSLQISNGLFKVDEIRVGRSWAEVTPHELIIRGTLLMIY